MELKTIKDYSDEDFARAEKKAKELNCDIIESSPTTILLDLDDQESRKRYAAVRDRIQTIFPGIKQTASWTSKSGVGMHVVLESPKELDVKDRLIIQACMGSDPIRELLSLKRVHDGIEKVSLLFKPKVS